MQTNNRSTYLAPIEGRVRIRKLYKPMRTHTGIPVAAAVVDHFLGIDYQSGSETNMHLIAHPIGVITIRVVELVALLLANEPCAPDFVENLCVFM